jgi:hypothetical protein
VSRRDEPGATPQRKRSAARAERSGRRRPALRAPNVSAEERLLTNIPRTLVAELLDKLDQAVREKPAQ